MKNYTWKSAIKSAGTTRGEMSTLDKVLNDLEEKRIAQLPNASDHYALDRIQRNSGYTPAPTRMLNTVGEGIQSAAKSIAKARDYTLDAAAATGKTLWDNTPVGWAVNEYRRSGEHVPLSAAAQASMPLQQQMAYRAWSNAGAPKDIPMSSFLPSEAALAERQQGLAYIDALNEAEERDQANSLLRNADDDLNLAEQIRREQQSYQDSANFDTGTELLKLNKEFPAQPELSLSNAYQDVVLDEAGRRIPVGDGPLDAGHISEALGAPSRLSQLQSLLSEYSPNLIGGGVGGLGGYLTSSLLDDDPDEEGLTPEERRARIAANRRRAALLSLGGAGLGAAAPYLNERFDLVNKAKELVGIA